MKDVMTRKIECLAKYLECEIEDLTVSTYDDCEFTYGSDEYWVCEDDEADQRAEDYILETLWAFRPEYLTYYMHFVDSMSNSERQSFVEILEQIQGKMCESCNGIIKSMVDSKLARLINDSIRDDGRGHFLAPYDFEENECEEFYIYKR